MRGALLFVFAWYLVGSVTVVRARTSPRQPDSKASCSCRIGLLQPSSSSSFSSSSSSSSLQVELTSWGSNSIRVRLSPDTIIDTPDIQALLPTPPLTQSDCRCSTPTHTTHTHAAAATNKASVTLSDLTNGNLHVVVRDDGSVTATRLSDQLVLLDMPSPVFNEYHDSSSAYKMPHSLYTIDATYNHAAGSIYGLGEHKTGSVRYSPSFSHLFETSQLYDSSRGGDIMIPWYLSSAGFGVLLNHAGYGYVDINEKTATWSFNATHQFDMWITTVATTSTTTPPPYAELMQRYAEATSFPPPLPSFASGFWQSKDRYRNQTEVLSIADEFFTEQVPLSIFVIDWQHWQYLGDWSFRTDNDCWSDPATMITTLQQSYNFTVMISAWPRVDPHSTHYAAMLNHSFFTTDGKGVPLITADGSTYLYDPFQQSARSYVWSALKQGYIESNGIRLFWLDASEPEQSKPGQQYWNGRSDREIGMSWPRYHQQTIYDGSKSEGMTQDEIMILSRSAWIGSNALNVLVWSGDVYSSWQDLNQQVRIAQNVGLSGIWWWTTDIGGYWGGDVTTEDFQQLLVRWFQFGAFCPVFRVHGHRFPEEPVTECGSSGGPNELWTYTYHNQINAIIALRESLRPYVEKQLLLASETGTPIVRPMFYDWSDTECTKAGGSAVDDQYMFGSEWLVAPVLQSNASSRSVYLPAGVNWKHYYTNTVYLGGQRIVVPTTLNDFPLFQRTQDTFADA